jgi:hypothetical protein
VSGKTTISKSGMTIVSCELSVCTDSMVSSII